MHNQDVHLLHVEKRRYYYYHYDIGMTVEDFVFMDAYGSAAAAEFWRSSTSSFGVREFTMKIA